MFKQTKTARAEAAEWLGDLHPLMEQLGSLEGLVTIDTAAASLRVPPADNWTALRLFLRNYQSRILLPLELVAVHRAYEHTNRNELNELMALGDRLAREPILGEFAAASQRIGEYQLQRLRPLRDQRFVQRYLQAVERGESQGWHTLVYGMTLALYSLPLRQGLMGFARQTLRGFIHCSARPLRLSESDCQSLLDEQCAELPAAVEGLFSQVAAA
jgi:urease accessory protein UreF